MLCMWRDEGWGHVDVVGGAGTAFVGIEVEPWDGLAHAALHLCESVCGCVGGCEYVNEGRNDLKNEGRDLSKRVRTLVDGWVSLEKEHFQKQGHTAKIIISYK